MKKKNTILVTISVIVIAVGSFFGGIFYQKSKDSLANVSPQDLPKKLQSLGMNNDNGFGGGPLGGNGNFPNRNRNGQRGGITDGEIINKDDKSITLKLQDGSTKTVYYSSTTTVGTIAEGTAKDLAVGQRVMANGTSNSDGSITANNIQMRPKQETLPPEQPVANSTPQ